MGMAPEFQILFRATEPLSGLFEQHWAALHQWFGAQIWSHGHVNKHQKHQRLVFIYAFFLIIASPFRFKKWELKPLQSLDFLPSNPAKLDRCR
jgi:hypothetical protein